MTQTHIQALDLSLQHNQGLLAQTTFLGLQDLTLVETVVNGLGKGVLLRIRHMATVKAHPLLESSITLIDLLLVSENLMVFRLDLLKQVSYFSWSVRHWDHVSTMRAPNLQQNRDLPSCINCSSTDAASSGI